jgi:hypothetical protein
MLGLAGDLGTMPIGDLLLYLGNKQLTGTLVCESGSAKKSLSIRDGSVINAGSNDPREYLGQFLINFGHITEDQLTKAFQTQAETQVPLGRILVMIGLVSEETLQGALAIKIRETTFGICRWKEGAFRFARGVLPADQEGVASRVSLLEIQREAEFRETAWAAMLQAFPSPKLALKVNEAKTPKDLQPGSLDAQLLDLMREGNLIEEISLRLHATDFHLYQRLYALYRQGVVAPYAPKPTKAEGEIPLGDQTVGEEMPAVEILRHAREFLAAKNFLDAETLAFRAAELDPGPDAQGVLKEAETSLLELLRSEMLAKPKKPSLAVPAAKLKELDLSSQEKYLLSRVDGARDIRAIIRVSPIRELDALKFFRRFLDSKLITLK